MTLEQQVVSLELAKQLKEAGYPQKGLFGWYNRKKTNGNAMFDSWEIHFNGSSIVEYELPFYIAPTVAELGELLPRKYWSGRNHNCEWTILDIDEERNTDIFEKTEADAQAKMWLYLKKEGLL